MFMLQDTIAQYVIMLEGTNYGTLLVCWKVLTMAHCLYAGGYYGTVILLHGTMAQYVIMLEDTNCGTICDCADGYYVTMCDHAGVLLFDLEH